jgi:hypothetical protein
MSSERRPSLGIPAAEPEFGSPTVLAADPLAQLLRRQLMLMFIFLKSSKAEKIRSLTHRIMDHHYHHYHYHVLLSFVTLTFLYFSMQFSIFSYDFP